MLKEYNIANIISIDDKWFSPEELGESIRLQGNDEDISLEEYCDAYVIDVYENEREQFQALKNERLKNIVQIKDRIPKTYMLIADNLSLQLDLSLETLEKVLKQLSEANLFHVYKEHRFSDRLRKIEGNTLYILDKDMGDNREDEFLDYIIDIIYDRKQTKDLIIVYSNEVSELLTHEKKVQYLKSKDIKGKELCILYQFWPVSKLTDERKLIEHIKEMTTRSAYGKALSKMIEVKQVSVNQALDDLLEIDIDNLDDMVLDSYIEGGKITESYGDLIESLVRKNMLESLSKTDILSYEKGLLKYESERGKKLLETKGVYKDKEGANKVYDNLRKKSKGERIIAASKRMVLHHSIADYSINRRYENPSMGDIYIFTDIKSHKEYAGLLISRQCSTVIRKDKYNALPGRTAKEFLVLLFDIVEITNENIKKKDVTKSDRWIWPVKIDEKMYFLENTRKSIYIDSDLLDLCGLNSEGKASVECDEKALAYKGAYSQEFYTKFNEKFQNRMKEMTSDVMTRFKVKEEKDSVSSMIVELTFGIAYDGNFKLRRICRLDEKRTLHIIHEYLSGIGEIGVALPVNL